MPLVHRFRGPAFAPPPSKPKTYSETRPLPASRAEGARPATLGHEIGAVPLPQPCPQCEARLPVFDLSCRCCVDRYESLFGSAREHRDVIARALQSALQGDMGPARRLVEHYRRVFGPMEAIALRRMLSRSISDLPSRAIDGANDANLASAA
jgi:hypothetical protein